MSDLDSKKNKNKMHSKQRRVFVALLATLAVISVLFCGYTFAKYVFGWGTNNHGIKATEFIFTSNLLNNDELSSTYNLYGTQAQSVMFSINNFSDELNINKSDIVYTISATATNNYIPILDTQVPEQSGGGFVLTGDIQSSHEFELDMPQGYTNGTIVTVTATSSSPYIKTITLEFRLHTDSLANEYRIEDSMNSYALNLVIMSKDNAQVTISWDPTELSIDCTNELVMIGGVVPPGVETGTLTLSRSLFAGESVAIAFFKKTITVNNSTDGNVPFNTVGEAIFVT